MVTGGCRDARLMVSTEEMSPRCDPARHSRVFYRVLSEGGSLKCHATTTAWYADNSFCCLCFCFHRLGV